MGSLRSACNGRSLLVPHLLFLAALLMASARTEASPNDECLACHGGASITVERQGKSVSLHTDPTVLARSAHAGLACTDCHAEFDAGSLPHSKKIVPVDCRACHGDGADSHPFHAAMQPPRGGDFVAAPASCKSCHGSHDVKRVHASGTPGGPGEVGDACERCHGDAVRDYRASEHGRASANGVRGAPECVTCHARAITPARAIRPGSSTKSASATTPDSASKPSSSIRSARTTTPAVAPTSASPPGADRVEKAADVDTAALKMEQEKLCLSCHLEDPEVRSRMAPTAGFIAAYQGSVHGVALLKGEGAAANCVDCHGSHTVARGSDPRASVSHARIPRTCARCHGAIAREYESSVHGRALARGNAQAPVCTSCHGEHTILRHDDPRSPVAARNVSSQVCTPCHSSVALSQKYGISGDRPATFAVSYHGLAVRAGSVEAANCASCHGAHAILPSSDPTSTVNKARLAETCGKCHPGANQRFAVGAVHVVLDRTGEPVLYWIATLYIGMIVFTIGAMFVHNVLDFLRKSRRQMKIRRGEIEHEPAGRALYLRMTLSERLQHMGLVLSFTVLVVTGFMLRYPDAWWVAWIRGLGEDVFALRSLLHRIAAVILVVSSAVHVYYCAFTVRGRRLLLDLLPRRRDLVDVLRAMKYNLGLSTRRPAFARFGYVEKSEYWALVWGTGVMVVTGFVMWFENVSIDVVTKLGWDVARTIHFYEAWLATLAILVWHIYHVVFNPDVYPMNMSWLTGRLTEAEMAEEHPVELEAIRAREGESVGNSEPRGAADLPGQDAAAGSAGVDPERDLQSDGPSGAATEASPRSG